MEVGSLQAHSNNIQFARKIPHGVTNKEFSKPTTSMCNQENFGNSNVVATPLMCYFIAAARTADYKSRVSFQKALTSCLQLLPT
jgi:hypothetical protein